MRDARARRRVDEGPVQRHPPLGPLVHRHHEHAVTGVKRTHERLGIAVIRLDNLGPVERGRAAGVADEESNRHSAGDQLPRHEPADEPARPGDDDHARTV